MATLQDNRRYQAMTVSEADALFLRIARLKAAIDSGPSAESCEIAAGKDCPFDRVVRGYPYAARELPGLFHRTAIIGIPFADHLEEHLFSLIGFMTAAVRRLFLSGRLHDLALKAQITSAEFFACNDRMQHDSILKK